MSEWLYAEAGKITPTDENLFYDLCSHQLHKPTSAFIASVKKIRDFWELAPRIMEVLAANIKAQTEVIFEQTGKLYMPADDTALHAKIAKEVRARVDKKIEETGSVEQATGFDMERGIEAFSGFLKHTKTLDGAVRLILESQLTIAWTAFETLAEDAWKAAQAVHPTAISTAQKPYFRKLVLIRQTYESLSPVSANINGDLIEPNAQIAAVFADSCLRKLNLMRNVIVHTSGIVDQEFMEQAKVIKWTVSDQAGQPLLIDGARVRKLINPVTQASQELIRAVDCWINLKTQGY